MLHVLNLLLHSRAAIGAAGGLVTAAGVDYHAFKRWNRWNDFHDFDWSTATFRWFSGAVVGAVTATGYGALLG